MNKSFMAMLGWGALMLMVGVPLFGPLVFFLPLACVLFATVMFAVQSASAPAGRRDGVRLR